MLVHNVLDISNQSMLSKGLLWKKAPQNLVQCPLDITTLDKAAALLIATSNPATNLRQYINSDLGYNDLKFQLLCSKIATVNSFEVVISNGLSFYRLHITFLNQMSFGNSDRAVYSDLNPLDGGQSLYPMSTVLTLPRRNLS